MALTEEQIRDGYFGLFIGQVASNDDPEKMGRVRAVVPALYSSLLSPWALPLGTVGGGRAGRGIVAIPPVGSFIGMFCDVGRPEAPYYLTGWWPAPDRKSQIPTPAGEKTGDPDNVVWETEKWRVWFADGSEFLRIESKDDPTNLFIDIDAPSGEITLSVAALKKLLLGDASAAQAAVLGDLFRVLFNAHTHSAGTLTDPVPMPGHAITGITGTPVTPMTTAELSTKVKVAT